VFFKRLFFRFIVFQIFCFIWNFPSFASEGSKAAGQTATPTALEQLFPYIILGLVLYFLLIRPQQRRYKQHGDFLTKIKRGDEVLTSGGIYGRIEGLTDSFVILEVAENVRIRIAKSQISSYAAGETEQSKTTKNKTK